MWYLISDHRESEKEEKRERAHDTAEHLKKQPIQYTNITPEDLILLIELNDFHHEGNG